ncbi:PREDICTED: uncharacterized protein LOC104775147, partial [Camelina sativa]
RDSPIHDDVVFPPIYHENLVVDSSIYGVDTYLESPSESSSPSSSSRHSGSSSSSFSLFPSDSDVLPSEFDRKSPSETEQKSPPLLLVVGESPPYDSDKQPKSPRVPSKQGGGDSDGKQLNREIDVFGDWWELL